MTLVGRRKLDHPSLGTAGGSALHASIETIYTNVGDDLGGRFKTAASVANSVVTTLEHNYGVQFADLKVLLYTGTHPNLTRVSDPVASGWTIAATVGFEKTRIDVTAPSSGGPHTFAVFIAASRGSEKLKDLDDVDFSVAPTDGQFFIYDNAATKWKPAHLKYMEETATIASNTITPTTGRNLQRITGSAADLHMLGSPSAGKLYVVVNETGSNVTVKNDTGATAANRIYTGTGVDFTLKNNAAITLIYDSGLSRWVLAGGSGGGGLQPTPQSTGVTAQAGTHYLTNTSGGAFTVTLPAGVAGSVVMVSDANETWDTFNLTVIPASGEKIDNLATNESLVCDVKRGWVELSWNTALSSWSMRSLSTMEFSIVSASNPGLMPSLTSSLDNATATQLGLKSYYHGTTYNGGNAPTVSNAQAGFSHVRSVFIPYQMQDGTWRMKFNINFSYTSTSVANLSNTNINGVVFAAEGAQAVTGATNSGTGNVGINCWASDNTNTISYYHNATYTNAKALISGDVELESKPTWAY